MKNIPVVMTIFGGSGDLAHRKLYPSLFNLYEQGLIHDNFAIVATARRPWTHDFLRQQVRNAIYEADNRAKEADVKIFASHFYYQSHDVTNVEHYETLKNLTDKLDQQYHALGNRIFYLAMAPRFFGTIATHINDQHLTSTGFNRIVVEKPFGRDFASAKKLNEQINVSFAEDDVFRMDHYLGKEMIQNIMPLRFTNPLIKNVWNAKMVDNIQVTLAEQLGVESRGGYYETAGALRDMVQNHIFQIITLLAMPEPKDNSAHSIHLAKQELLNSLLIPTKDQVEKYFVRGQYLGNDQTLGYQQEDNVDQNSLTETYVAGEVKFTKGPLAQVPIYFRTGKELREKETRVDIILKNQNTLYGKVSENSITIEIDPHMRVYMAINGKNINHPGIRREQLLYSLSDNEMAKIPDGYERLLHDVFVNDSTNFTHWSELKRYWEFIDAIEKVWQQENQTCQKITGYPSYQMGPEAANEILPPKNKHWLYE